MFAIHGNRLPMVCSYNDALTLWEHAEPFKSAPAHRQLVSDREYDKRMERDGDSIKFVYHRTAVVTWHGPGLFAIVPWSSASTTIFANRFLPSGVHLLRGDTLVIDGSEFKLKDCVTCRREGDSWAITPESLGNVVQYHIYKVDRKRVPPEALDRLKTLQAWMKMTGRVMAYKPSVYDLRDAAQMLLDDKPVPEIAAKCRYRADDLATALMVITSAVRKEPLPLGSPKPRSKYEKFPSVHFASSLD